MGWGDLFKIEQQRKKEKRREEKTRSKRLSCPLLYIHREIVLPCGIPDKAVLQQLCPATPWRADRLLSISSNATTLELQQLTANHHPRGTATGSQLRGGIRTTVEAVFPFFLAEVVKIKS